MRISLLITDQGYQVSMEGQDAAEKAILKLLRDQPLDLSITAGPIYARTQGGYIREFDERPNNEATVIVMTKPTPAQGMV